MRLLVTLFLLLSPLTAWSLCVSVSQANLRAKPSAKSKLLWTVGKYMPLLAIEQKGDWILVKDLEGKKMWVYESLVSDRIDCAVVRINKSTLRKGPGKEFSKTSLSFAHRYMPFKKIEREGPWLQLQDDYGFKHWVLDKSVWEPLAYSQLNY